MAPPSTSARPSISTGLISPGMAIDPATRFSLEIERTQSGAREGSRCRGARVVHQNSNPVVLDETLLDREQLGGNGEVGGQDIDGDAGLRAQPRRERLHPRFVARHEHEVMAAVSETVRVDGADPRRRAGNEDGGKRIWHDLGSY